MSTLPPVIYTDTGPGLSLNWPIVQGASPLNLSSVTGVTFTVTKPDGTSTSWTGSIIAPSTLAATASVVAGSPLVTLSAPTTLAAGQGLIFPGSPNPNAVYSAAASISGLVNLVLSSPYAGPSATGLIVSTVLTLNYSFSMGDVALPGLYTIRPLLTIPSGSVGVYPPQQIRAVPPNVTLS